MGFPGQEYWSGLPFPSLEGLPNPGVKPTSPAWQSDSLPLSHLGSPKLENAGLDPATFHMQSDCCAIWASSPFPSHVIQQFHCWVYIWRKHCIKRYMHSDFHGSIIYSSQDMKQFECPLLDEWIKKWHVYVYTHTHTHVHNRRFSAIIRMKSCLCNNIDEPKECYA